MIDKKITDVDYIDSLNSDESFFVNKNSSIKQINKSNIVFGINNGGTGATTVQEARENLGIASSEALEAVGEDLANVNVTLSSHVSNIENPHMVTTEQIGALPTSSITSATFTISVEDWNGGLEYTKTGLTGVTSSNIVIISPIPTSYTVWGDYKIRAAAQGENSLTFVCEETPEESIGVNVVILEV